MFLILLRSLTSGQKPMCDLSGPTTGNYKDFTWQTSWENLPSHTRLGAQPKHCSLREELWSRIQAPPAQPCSFTYLPSSPGHLNLEALYQGTSTGIEAFLSHLFWDLLMERWEGHVKTLFSTLTQHSVLFHSLLASSLFSPPAPGTMRTFYSGFAWQWDNLAWCSLLGKTETMECLCFLLGSILYILLQ